MQTSVEKFCTQVYHEREEIFESWLREVEKSLPEGHRQSILFRKEFSGIIDVMVDYVRSNTDAARIRSFLSEELGREDFRRALAESDLDRGVEELILLKLELKRFMIRNGIYEVALQEKVSDYVLHVIQILSGQKRQIYEAKITEEIALREQFVLSLIHDLRGPLAAAKLSAQFLMKKTSDAGVSQSVEKIVGHIHRSEELISNILDAKKIELGERMPLAKKMTSSGELLEDCLRELRETHGERFILSVEDFKGNWDESALKRIIINLAGNAVKYGDESLPITLGALRSGDRAKFWVQNFGPRISPADQKRIFRAFARLSPESERRGWGLGLTLVRGLTEAHDGTVEVRSNESEGTVFTVFLPIGEA